MTDGGIVTPTDTPVPQFYELGFDHAAARAKAISVVLELEQSLGGDRTTSISIDHAYNVRVQFGPETIPEALRLVHSWSASSSHRVEDAGDQWHHLWNFYLNDVEVAIVLVVMDDRVLS